MQFGQPRQCLQSSWKESMRTAEKLKFKVELGDPGGLFQPSLFYDQSACEDTDSAGILPTGPVQSVSRIFGNRFGMKDVTCDRIFTKRQ